MISIEHFEDVFSKKKIKETRFYLSKTSPNLKNDDVLNIIAVTHGFKDYKTAKNLYLEYLKQNPRWTLKNDRNNFNIQENFESNSELISFLESYKNHTFLKFNYSFYLKENKTNENNKKKIKEIIEKHNGILFSFNENEELGFNTDFNIIIESNEKKVNLFIADIYMNDLNEYSKTWNKKTDEMKVSEFIKSLKNS